MCKRNAVIFFTAIMVAVLAGCAHHKPLSEKKIWEVPQGTQEIMKQEGQKNGTGVLGIDDGKLGDKVVLQGPADNTPAGHPYTAVWIAMPTRLAISEGMYGLRHDMFFHGGEKPGQYADKKNFVGGIRIVRQGRPHLLFIDKEGRLDPGKKAYIQTRSGKRQYVPDGKVFGELEQRFSWDEIKPLGEYPGVKISLVVPGSPEDVEIRTALAGLAAEIQKLYIPDLMERVLQKIGKIGQEDIFLAMGGGYMGLFSVVGVRAWGLIELAMGDADLRLPYYDTSPVTADYLGKVVAPLYEASGVEQAALQKWEAEMADYVAKKAEYNRLYGDMLK